MKGVLTSPVGKISFPACFSKWLRGTSVGTRSYPSFPSALEALPGVFILSPGRRALGTTAIADQSRADLGCSRNQARGGAKPTRFHLPEMRIEVETGRLQGAPGWRAGVGRVF